MRQTGDESDALESDGGCRHGLILEACDTCQLSIATAENERLKRDAEIYEGLNKQRHEVIDELFLVKAERDRYRTVLQGIADDTDADGFELRQAARRALTNTTPPPAAEPDLRAALDSIRRRAENGRDDRETHKAESRGIFRAIAEVCNAALGAAPSAAAPPVALRDAREVAHAFEAGYEDCPGPLPQSNGHSHSCDRLTEIIEADRTQRTPGLPGAYSPSSLRQQLSALLVECGRQGYSRDTTSSEIIALVARSLAAQPRGEKP